MRTGTTKKRRGWLPALLPLFLLVTASLPAGAGPPYVTDDPEPADYQHWEFYLASEVEHDKGGWLGTGPHLEVNYGALPNLHPHFIAPVVFSLPVDGTSQYGYGDTEVRAKVRFIQETDWCPMVGTFPLPELPSGDKNRGLGTGNVETFLPVWLQKSFGPWITYGGGGYWINPGTKDYWFFG